MIWEIWWAWVAAGLALAILEILAPGYIFAGFAIGAVLVGALIGLGLGLTLPWALVIFAVTSLAAWFAIRRLLGTREGQVKTFDRDINED
ncbi:MAG: hypothetical protein KDK10_01160 [Maritimibacter sp.]|nr:hypothetical protein [Maritimibacter sp.]